MENVITADNVGAIVKQHEDHLVALKTYVKQNPEAGALVGFAITGITGANEALQGHLKNLSDKAAADAAATKTPAV